MAKGYIKLHRQIKDNWVWDEKPFSKGQAWVDLLFMASHEEHEFLSKGEVVHLTPGQFVTCDQILADAWGWNRKRVRRFIKMLEKSKMVTTCRTPRGTTLSIVNWDKFQSQGTTIGTTKGTTGGTTGGTTDGTLTRMVNNDKEGRRGYARPSEEEAFEEMLESWYQEAKAKEDANRGL